MDTTQWMLLGVGVLGAVFAVWFAMRRTMLGVQKFQRASQITACGSRALPVVSIAIAYVLTLYEQFVIVSIGVSSSAPAVAEACRAAV